MKTHPIRYADDDINSIRDLLLLRIPSLGLGLLLGIALSFTTSRFEEVIAKDINVAFFIPLIVYMAAAVGTQTQSIYSRDLKTGMALFRHYFMKESILGLILGSIAGLMSALITYIWFQSPQLTLAVGLSMAAAIAIAPIIAVLITEFLQLKHKDPAVGAGPIFTVLQDTLSILIYGAISSAILL